MSEILIELRDHAENQNFHSQCIYLEGPCELLQLIIGLMEAGAEQVAHMGSSVEIYLDRQPFIRSNLSGSLVVQISKTQAKGVNGLKGDIVNESGRFLWRLGMNELESILEELREMTKRCGDDFCHFGEWETEPTGIAIAWHITDKKNF